MKNKKSYSEIMKSRTNQTKSAKDFMLDLYIQMIFDEAILVNRKKSLEEKINEALDTNNVQQFKELAIEYNKIIQAISS